jgi:hypothetical protein
MLMRGAQSLHPSILPARRPQPRIMSHINSFFPERLHAKT